MCRWSPGDDDDASKLPPKVVEVVVVAAAAALAARFAFWTMTDSAVATGGNGDATKRVEMMQLRTNMRALGKENVVNKSLEESLDDRKNERSCSIR